MDRLIELSENLISNVQIKTVRSMMHHINWKARLIGIQGARGVGKTTLLLQYTKLNLTSKLDTTLYVSLDDVWFNNHSLIDFRGRRLRSLPKKDHRR